MRTSQLEVIGRKVYRGLRKHSRDLRYGVSPLCMFVKRNKTTAKGFSS
jgi:hypothetical protein